MNARQLRHWVIALLFAFSSAGAGGFAFAQTRSAPPDDTVSLKDIPESFENKAPEADFIKRVEMVPMRDGVKLYTVIFIPKGARNTPIILTRTPYDAAGRSSRSVSPSMLETLPLGDEEIVEQGYIRVYQDVRGKYGSEGDYVLTWPLRGPLNPTSNDHSTDAWDTIDWLVKNVPESNGRVGMIGSSYEGFTAIMALFDPHPALRAVVPESPLVDAWMGDDWFHYGAFRNIMLGYIQMQTAQRGHGAVTPSYIYDKYEEMLRAGSTGDYLRAHGLDKLPWIKRLLAHPAYDGFWQGQALDKLLAARPSTVPTLWEQGLWDQEDMWGANQSWRALTAAGHGANNWLVLGPWSHSQINGKGYSLGPLSWEGDTAKQYRRDMVMPFFNQFLRDGPPANLARVTVYNTGKNEWEHFDDWPVACQSGCATPMTPLYLKADYALSFDRPTEAKASDKYVSDPAKPVPFLPRPVLDPFFGYGSTGEGYKPWSKWLVEDQRFVDSRPDVLVYETPVLDKEVHVQGIPIADILAATTGTDGDFVVKLIDVYPAQYPSNPSMGGYQLSISQDIFRGRYRKSFEHPSAIPANVAQRYRFELPNVNHVFKPGHRIMVHIQSSQFPLYDRNPQTFVPNIFNAKPGDYRPATISILRSREQSSAVWLPVVKP
ncbi:CocE/NonD family hydrolase [Sphingosinicella rhizophila]|uniref:CocE/NonD family hydrolase n=1 Tax=Sphingosinicella rhizophila TaxID=3050082 RepID=A0ABU3Q5Y8_9SPHN|nr:CocE/NonD family hydrolase [Sphingosinicella sp. GR2756]MDT9598822.1 CocE/NonD family hydrolase [Sphingosinicella sp. GR2756]